MVFIPVQVTVVLEHLYLSGWPINKSVFPGRLALSYPDENANENPVWIFRFFKTDNYFRREPVGYLYNEQIQFHNEDVYINMIKCKVK